MISEIAKKVLDELKLYGGEPYLVGGSVRDHLLGIESRDYDIEVLKMSPEKIKQVLSQFGHVDAVGLSFGVLKLRIVEHGKGMSQRVSEFDVSIPRRESKSGKGHKGFIPEFDPTMTPQEAAARRDFTINAMAMTPDGEILDYFSGQEDLKNKILRHTSPAFVEDPLRVLRAMQFAGRFEMSVFQETRIFFREEEGIDTSALCFSMISEYPDLPKERIWGEWKKWAVKSIKPSMGLDVLRECLWLSLYPELHDLFYCEQDPGWHPEGNVLEHSWAAVDHAVMVATREGLSEFDRLVLVFSALLHDVGKPSTTTHDDDGHIRSKGHAAAGVPIAKTFLKSIGAPAELIEHVLPLVKDHLAHIDMKEGSDEADRQIRRLSRRLSPSNISMWAKLVECDHSARPPLPVGAPAEWIVKRAEELAVQDKKPAEILMGRHLIGLGMKPNKDFGIILKGAYNAQIEGEFSDLDGALAWMKDVGFIE